MITIFACLFTLETARKAGGRQILRCFGSGGLCPLRRKLSDFCNVEVRSAY